MRPTTIFIILAIAALGYLAYLGKISGIKAPDLPSLPDIQMPQLPSLGLDEKLGSVKDTGIYKWQDANGHWHYGDSAPEGVTVKVVDVDMNRNVLPSTKSAPQQNDEASLPSGEPLPGIAGSMGQMQQIMKGVKPDTP